MPWSEKFREPITLPSGQQLITLSDAGGFILRLSKKRKAKRIWVKASELLIKAAEEGGVWVDLARSAMIQAIGFPEPKANGHKTRRRR